MATLNELKEAIIKAHKAGNAEDAKVLAKAITKIQTQSKKPEKLIEKPEKLTEELIIKDPNWIQSSKKLYEWDWKRKNPNQNVPKISNEGYAQFGLDYGSGLAFSDVDLIREGQAIGNATDEQKEAFVNIMNMYDAKSPSLAGAGRAFKNIINPLESPTTYLGFGAGKLASTGVKQVAKNQLKENIIKSLVVSKPGRYALIGSAEGASYGAAYDVARQRAKIRAEGQKDYEAGSIAKSAGIGTVFGGVLGGGVGVISSAITRRKKQKDPEEILSTAEKEEEILKEVVPETQQILSPKPTQINPNSASALQQKTLEDQAIQSTISKKIEDIVSPMKEDLNISVSEDVGILGKIPYIGNVYKNLANNTLNKIQAKTQRFSTLKDLPQQPQYLGVRGIFAGKAEQADVLARNVFESFNKLTPKQNKPIYEFLTGNKTLDDVPKDLQKEALNLRSGIDTVSEVLERESLISKEVMEENYGTYLPRLFLKYFNKNSGSMGYLKERKNLDAATKDFLGEIEDVGLLGAKAIQDPISDVVKLGFFKEISNNPNWAVQDSLVPFRGKNIGIFHAKSEADRISKEVVEGLRTDPKKAMQTVDDLKKSINTADEKIAKIDKNKFKQISDERKYGELRGMYVRKEIYDDIIDAPSSGQGIANSINRKGKELTKIWKTLKVPMNPPSVVRNFISNMVLLNLSGVSTFRLPLRMVEALEQIITKGKYYKEAQKYGVASTTFSKQEMIQIKTMYKMAKAQKTKNFIDIADSLGSKMLNFAGDSYGFIETFGKLIKIIDDRKAGKNAETAVYNAQKTLFDYSLVPSTLKELRQNPFGLPFATFQYKVLPFLLESFIRHPERYIKYMAVPYLAAAVWKKQNENMTNEDLESLKKTLPKYLRDGGNALVLPYKDDEGRWQFYDYSYTMPWGFYTGIGNKIVSGEYGEAKDDVIGLWGGPGLNAVAAITTNKDPFTNREIINPSASPAEKAESLLHYTWRQAAPTWLTDIGFAGKMYEAVTKEPNFYGDPTITKPQAWYRLVGQNVYPIDPEQSRNTNLYFKKKDIQDTQKYYRKKIREADLRNDIEGITRLEQEAKQKIDLLADEFVEYEEQSKIPERLKRN